MANYYVIDKTIMPTRGQLYPSDAIIKVRPLSIADVKFISSIEAFNATIVINEVVERCCKFEHMSIEDLYLADRDFIIFWLRSNSFVSSSGYSLQIEHCPYCNMPISKTIRLQDFDVEYIKEQSLTIKLTMLPVEVKFSLPKMLSKRIITNDPQVNDILLYSNIASLFKTDDPDRLEYLITRVLNAEDYANLADGASSIKCGIKEQFFTSCDRCRNKIPITIQLSEETLFDKFDLMDILRLELITSKYTGYQLSEDTPYTEVELMQKIIAEMQQKEQEQMRETSSNMRMPNLSSLRNMTNRLRR